MIIINNNNISLSRGNNAIIDVTMIKDGESYTLASGEKIMFHVKRKNEFNKVVLSKESTENSFYIAPSDTATMGLGSYVYSITYYGNGGEIDTFITGEFNIMSEVS